MKIVWFPVVPVKQKKLLAGFAIFGT